MLAKKYETGQKFKHITGDIVEVIEIDGIKLFEIENIGTFSYIDDDYILYEI